MSNAHYPDNDIHLGSRRPDRCLRHRVWMAACDDCHDAHIALVGAPRRRTRSTR